MNELLDRFFKNWKSTLIAGILCVCLVMLYRKQITVTDFVLVMGSVGVFYGILKKDTDI